MTNIAAITAANARRWEVAKIVPNRLSEELRMGGAQRYPSIAVCEDDGFREGLYPSYGLETAGSLRQSFPAEFLWDVDC